MRFPIVAILASLLLAACVGGNVRPPQARFDFGATAVAQGGAEIGLAAVEVAAPSWLAGQGMQYRLAYGDAGRRDSYADSRWVAPPAELLERALSRRLAGAGSCRLRLELDEFIQVFDNERMSRLVLAGRASLLAGRETVARRAFSLARPTASADAAGGVAAATQVVDGLGEEIAGWLAAQGGRCRAG